MHTHTIKLSDITIEYETFGTSGAASMFSRGTRSESHSGHVAGRWSKTLDEITGMNADDILLLWQSVHPFVVGNIRYYAEREFIAIYDPV